MKKENKSPDKYEHIRKPLNRRAAKRHRWAEYTGIAILTDEKREFIFQPVDVSETGMCILSQELFAKGDMVLFLFENTPIRLEVVRVGAEESRGVFCYGLHRINENQKLDEIFLKINPT